MTAIRLPLARDGGKPGTTVTTSCDPSRADGARHAAKTRSIKHSGTSVRGCMTCSRSSAPCWPNASRPFDSRRLPPAAARHRSSRPLPYRTASARRDCACSTDLTSETKRLLHRSAHAVVLACTRCARHPQHSCRARSTCAHRVRARAAQQWSISIERMTSRPPQGAAWRWSLGAMCRGPASV